MHVFVAPARARGAHDAPRHLIPQSSGGATFYLRSAALIAALLIWPRCAQTQDVREEVRAEVHRFVATLNRNDAPALARLYAERPDVATLGDGEIRRGWAAVAALLDTLFAAGPVRIEVDSVIVVPLGSVAALAYFRYQWVQGEAGSPIARGAMTLVLERSAAGWRVLHDHTSTLVAAPVPPTRPLSDSGPTTPVRQTRACVITRVVDGDTIDCRPGGRVRLIGIDTPELDQAPHGRQAAAALADLTPVGTTVQLEPDVEPRDRYGRVLAYVWTDAGMVNWLLIRQGWAVLLTYPPNVQYVDWFTSSQARAREERRGLWEHDAFQCLPAEHRRGRCD